MIQELIKDLLKADPALKNIKSELEKLIQEFITNKPETPFTQDFKESLRSQIIWAINEHKLYKTKKSEFTNLLHSFRFWMIWISSIATCLLVFGIFQYLGSNNPTDTQISYISNIWEQEIIEEINNEISTSDIQSIQKPTTIVNRKNDENITNIETVNYWWASARTDNVMMIPDPQNTISTAWWSNPSFDMMAKTSQPIEELAIAESNPIEDSAISPSPTLCETSRQFLTLNNISTETNTSKNFTYKNQIYQATVNYINNNISIKHIGTKDESQLETIFPDIKQFLANNNFDISKDYNSPVIEESDSFVEYYFPRYNWWEWITARIDKSSNIIFSIDNICIY